MGTNYFAIIATIINFAILVGVIIVIYKAVQWLIKFTNRNKEID